MNKIRTYSELISHNSFLERFRYLVLKDNIGNGVTNLERYLNQKFYKSSEWKRVHDYVIVRDSGCDLGIPERELIGQKIYVHHMNPLSKDDIINKTNFLLDPEFLITTCHATHNAIHYGGEESLFISLVERSKNDTCPWKK